MSEKSEVNIKQRIVGAIVLVSLGIIIIPILLDGGKEQQQDISNSNIPVLPSHLDKEIAPVAKPKPRYQPAPVSVRPVEELTQGSAQSKSESKQAAVQTSNAVSRQDQTAKVIAKPAQSGNTEVKHNSSAVNFKTASKPKTSAINTAYTIQVGSFSYKNNAFSLRDKLRKEKFKAYIESVTISAGIRYRVRVGPFLNYDEAEKNRDKLLKKNSLKGSIVKYKT